MTSREKIVAFRDELLAATPPDEETMLLQQAVRTLGPMFEGMIPTDPATLDQWLLVLATWALSVRSDTPARDDGYAIVRVIGEPLLGPVALDFRPGLLHLSEEALPARVIDDRSSLAVGE